MYTVYFQNYACANELYEPKQIFVQIVQYLLQSFSQGRVGQRFISEKDKQNSAGNVVKYFVLVLSMEYQVKLLLCHSQIRFIIIIGDWDWRSGWGIGIGDWDLGLGIRIGDQDWGLGLGIRIGDLNLGLGIGIEDWGLGS